MEELSVSVKKVGMMTEAKNEESLSRQILPTSPNKEEMGRLPTCIPDGWSS